MKELYLDLRGTIGSMTTDGSLLTLGTTHPDGHELPGYVLDPDKGTLTTGPRPEAPPFEGTTLTLGKNAFELPAPISAFALDASGSWAVAGCTDGTVAVFHAAKRTFVALESAKLHNGEVTALAWEPSEPRFWSAGTDHQILSTHAKGALQSIDRAGKNKHTGTVRALVLHDDLLLSAGDDSVLKLWDRNSRKRPSSVKSAGKAVALAVVHIDGIATIALCTATQVRLFPLEKGRTDGLARIFHGALAKITRELEADATRRQAALKTLAAWDDTAAIQLLERMATRDDDHKLRLAAVHALAGSSNPASTAPLEGMLADRLESLRIPAYEALVRRVDGLRPLDLALQSGAADLGRRAVEALATLATDEATDRLLATLGHGEVSVRTAVITALETLYPEGPTASILALQSPKSDTRQLAAIRLQQRGLLQDPAAVRALRTLGEDSDAGMRHTAYTLRIMAWPHLTAHLAWRDSDFARAVHGITTHGKAKPGKLKKAPKPKAGSEPETLSPLVQASSSRQADTSTRGASHLAALGDARALGVLLQLSRHTTPDIRGKAARALALLGDDKALSRLRAMLRDDARAVRDAAFSALSSLLSKTPLDAVDAGFVASHVDVRARALALLVKSLRKPTKRARSLLLAALNDPDTTQQGNAFKAALTLGDSNESLSFVLQSLRPSTRRLALTEIMAEVQAEWAYRLLLACFDDPDTQIRTEALTFARKKAKGRKPSSTLAALGSRHADMRLSAIEVLAQKVDADAATHLASALDDPEQSIRGAALQALQRADARDAIAAALDSTHEDVRIHAASTLAAHGDPRALAPLLAQLEVEEPTVSDTHTSWLAMVRAALAGLARLGDPAASTAVASLLDHKTLGKDAATALCWLADVPTLRAHLKGPDAIVRPLALALAWRGLDDGAPLVFDGKNTPADVAAAALALEDTERFLALLDDRASMAAALRILALYVWSDPGFPDVLLSALAAPHGPVRLAVARLLADWNDPSALAAVVHDILGTTHLPLREGLLRQISLAVRHGEGLARVSVIRVVAALEATPANPTEGKQLADLLDHTWSVLSHRYPELTTIADPGPQEPADLQPVVYGTLVALAGQIERRGQNIRAQALRRLGGLVSGDDLYDAALPALQDPHASVRRVAFDLLADTDFIAAEALASGHDDLGLLALDKLSEHNADILIEVATTRMDDLAVAAWRQFCITATGSAGVSEALSARHPRVRRMAVYRADSLWETDPALLTGALQGTLPDVRVEVAMALGRHRQKAAWPTLFALLRDPDHAWGALRALRANPEIEVANGILDRLDEPLGSIDAESLFDAVGDLRRPEVADRLVALADKKPFARHALSALLTISGYNQRLHWDPEEPDADSSWLDDQHPRHDAVFAAVLDLAAARKDRSLLQRQWRGSAWAQGETDGPLMRMIDHADDRIRQGATAAYGWRVRFRSADPAPLVRALSHKDSTTAFLAAEGLAQGGHGEGISVLLASVDTLQDLGMRHRAVLALGRLADARALEPLMAIAADAEHALVESAAEALGHLSAHPEADTVQDRLLALSALDSNIGARALVGLRWFGSPTAWARIREVTRHPEASLRRTAAALLQFDPDPDSTDLRRMVLEDEAWHVRDAASTAWRRKAGPESLEPDYAFALTAHLEEDTLQRLREQGDPERLLSVVTDARCTAAVTLPLLLTLAESTVPPKALVTALESPLPRSVDMAARLIGRRAKLTAPMKKALAARALDVRTPPSTEGLTAATLESVWWAAARHGLLDPIATHLDHGDADIRAAAARAARASGDPALAEKLVAVGTNADRTLAARTLPAGSAVLSDLLDDPSAADAALAREASVPEEAVLSLHTQGIVVPHLVRSRVVAPFEAALGSTEAHVRLGALEALGRIGDTDGEALLQGFATNESHPDEERRHAWRCIRRSRRVREARP